MKPPRWLPDWKDPSAYPDASKTKRTEWAWQFLRRNHQYREMWAQLIKPQYKRKDVKTNVARAEMGRSVHYVVGIPRVRLEEIHYPLTPFRERFRIATIPLDPSESEASIRFTSQINLFALKSNVERPYKVETFLQHGELLIWFNLQGPIETQLQNAMALLNEHCLKRFRARTEKYALYLRLLDAREVGARNKEIAAALYQNIKNQYPDYAANRQARTDSKVATRLRDQDFWRIAAAEE